MYNLIKSEYVKLRQNRTYQILIGLSLLSSISCVTLFYLAFKNILYIELSNGFTILEATPSSHFDITGVKAFSVTLLNHPLLLLLVMSVFAGFFISNDYRSGAFKNAIVSGNERYCIYIAKWIVFTFGIIIALTLFTLLTTVLSSLLFGFGAGIESVLELIKTFGLYILQVASYASILVLLAFLVEESGKTITLSLIAVFGIWFLLDFSARHISFMGDVFQATVFYQLIAVVEYQQSIWEVTKGMLGGMMTIFVSSTLGIIMFQQKELK
ncbi:ABC transporter permease [Lederbergia sp. NSJ-179]|uniref:ABC transporter permease n=1 Tax=Lederbergia sp. NSJ-179 TaxID=2931402 RepID=UPI001FD0978C|nr:ABC transporter permease [Lederbergia sp. NSJ-179]MCJ7843453.1 ABC transporter permease [Lederbergia sp. NSJ-179]